MMQNSGFRQILKAQLMGIEVLNVLYSKMKLLLNSKLLEYLQILCTDKKDFVNVPRRFTLISKVLSIISSTTLNIFNSKYRRIKIQYIKKIFLTLILF